MLKYNLFPLFFALPFSAAFAADTEYSVNQKAYDALGASQAYALGFTGAGVTVAVVDNGTLATHQELKDKFSELQKDEYNHYQDIADQTGASTATISRVNRSLTYGAGGYQLVLSRLGEDPAFRDEV